MDVQGSGKSSSKSSGKTLENTRVLLREFPAMTIPELAQRLQLTERTIQKHIRSLKQAELLKRVGSRKSV